MITQAELGRRLRLARLNVGLSQEAVAAELDVPRPTISQIESGKRGVSSLELAKLARIYRRSLAAFFEDDPEQVQADDLLSLLSRTARLSPEDRRTVADFMELCRAYHDLEVLLGLESEASPPAYCASGEPTSRNVAMRQGEQVAAEERRRLSVGDAPIRDIFILLESQGVRVFERPLRDREISGIFLYDDAAGPCVLVNGTATRGDIAFYVAHEYAHALLDRRLRAHASSAGRLLTDRNRRGDLLEWRANSFAAAFLLPVAGIERFLGARGRPSRDGHPLGLLDVLYLQRAFGVGPEATLYRLENLGWLGRDRRTELAWHRPEALAHALVETDGQGIDGRIQSAERYPVRYVYLALEAYRRSEISLGKLAELLGQDLAEARALVWDIGAEPEEPLAHEAV
jgi:Zn-dependent peptidase ImmA (M78 family)/transcriptional regulator with XRE-family HTH domain